MSVIVVISFAYLWFQEPQLVVTVKGEVLALEEVEDSNGKRRIHVKMPNGSTRWIETYVPFFYKVGYPIRIEVYGHKLAGTTYKVAAP